MLLLVCSRAVSLLTSLISIGKRLLEGRRVEVHEMDLSTKPTIFSQLWLKERQYLWGLN